MASFVPKRHVCPTENKRHKLSHATKVQGNISPMKTVIIQFYHRRECRLPNRYPCFTHGPVNGSARLTCFTGLSVVYMIIKSPAAMSPEIENNFMQSNANFTHGSAVLLNWYNLEQDLINDD